MAKKKSTTRRPQPGQTRSRPRRLSPDFVFYVAELAWHHGWAQRTIVKHLMDDCQGNFDLPDDPDRSQRQAKTMMKVKHALKRAFEEGLLRLRPGRDRQLAKSLARVYPRERDRRIRFAVMDDRFAKASRPVCWHAAGWFGRMVQQMLASEQLQDKKEIVIANAGGRTVSQMLRYLRRMAPILEEEHRKRLTFVSLNTAGFETKFEISANFLAVRMAEILGGRHHAVIAQRRCLEQYEERIANIDLLVCGLGAKDGMLAAEFREHDMDFPEEAMGDLAFIPFGAKGQPLATQDGWSKVFDGLNPRPSVEELSWLRNQGRILLMIDGGVPCEKADIAKTVLSGGWATHCVLGATLATTLVATTKTATPVKAGK